MLNIASHRKYMYEFIKEFFVLPQSSDYAFKGGTMAYFLYNLDRFSTDIDIDCLQGLPSLEFQKEIEKLIQSLGKIKEFQSFRNMYRYIFSYGESDHNIKIEFNERIRKANKYETANFFGIPLQVMEKSTMFANKLVALVNRPKLATRDLWDIRFFFKNNFPINTEVIEERTEKNIKNFIQDLIVFLDTKCNKSVVVDANLGIVLTDQQKRWAKKYLVSEVRSLLEYTLFELDHK